MATFLTSPRMNPALRARVERAVSPRVRAKQKARALGYQPFEGRAPFAVARLLPIAAFALVLALGLTMHAAGRRELEAERGALLGALASRRAGLPPGYQGFGPVAAVEWRPSLRQVKQGGGQRSQVGPWAERPAVKLLGWGVSG